MRLLLLWATCFSLAAQSTQGVISGQAYDARTGLAVTGARVVCSNLDLRDTRTTPANVAGFYAATLLSAGNYSVRAEAEGYQPLETFEIQLHVGGRIEIDFPLRSASDVFGDALYAGGALPSSDAIVHYYAADFETTRTGALPVLNARAGVLQTTMSYSVNSMQLRDLPLYGRDVYTLLVTLPNVSADNATARGIGLSVSGQRVSSSNFLLDGTEANNYLLTGPLAPVPPEAVQEYRISTNNYSAEYGRTGGYVANAITRSGSDSFHGEAYAYIGNELLNGNSLALNAAGEPRSPLRESYLGYAIGGPLKRGRAEFSSVFEHYHNRNRDPSVTVPVPLPDRIAAAPNRGNSAVSVLGSYPAPVPNIAGDASCQPTPLTGCYRYRQETGTDRIFALERVDAHSKDGKQSYFVRYLLSRITRPDFIPSVYKGLSSPLNSDADSVTGSYIRRFGRAANELRLGWNRGDLGWPRPDPGLPALFSGDGTLLPGSPAAYEYRNRGQTGEADDNVSFTLGTHLLTAGGGWLERQSDSLLSYGRDGYLQFQSAATFALDIPSALAASVSRQPGQAIPYDRSYTNSQFFGFFQDSWKARRNLTLNLGVRYESFGVPKNTGARDGYIVPGATGDPSQRVRDASLVFGGQGGIEPYRPDRNNFAPRFGISWSPGVSARTIVRGGFGIFFDRPFDNLTQNVRANSFGLAVTPLGFTYSYTATPISDLLRRANTAPSGDTPLYWIDGSLRTPYVESWFAGVQHFFPAGWYAEINQTGALGRKLIVTDALNRTGSNIHSLPEIVYRSNFGSSDYLAVTALARYQGTRGQFQAAYTYGHSIDNQSEPLLGDAFDLAGLSTAGHASAALSQEFNSRVDRGNSDFDQRHNVVFFSILDLPNIAHAGWRKSLLGGWQFGQIAGFRSGFPYSVVDPYQSGAREIEIRPSLKPGVDPFSQSPQRPPGGVQLLNRSAFTSASAGRIGNLGRNTFIGPGFWNVDLSLGKSYRLTEAAAVQVRADCFNVFNHTNLGNPIASLADPRFGTAFYGRTGVESSFPAASPLNEAPRTIQMQIKLRF